jgi:hypothetical protein
LAESIDFQQKRIRIEIIYRQRFASAWQYFNFRPDFGKREII